MSLDAPWLNQLIPDIIADPLDISPKGFFYFFKNMNFASMSLATFGFFLFLYGLTYLICS